MKHLYIFLFLTSFIAKAEDLAPKKAYDNKFGAILNQIGYHASKNILIEGTIFGIKPQGKYLLKMKKITLYQGKNVITKGQTGIQGDFTLGVDSRGSYTIEVDDLNCRKNIGVSGNSSKIRNIIIECHQK